ncbi:MAG: ATP-binding cassette domain-containing protein [Eubacterium sp.]|nr:ATP-binding cassette domain-containing protein [Eubacterium sp.]
MSWFDDQIRARQSMDDDALEEAFIEVASSILGKKGSVEFIDDKLFTRNAMDEILKYYHFRSSEIPDDVRDKEDEIEYLMRPHGMMKRIVTLDKAWHKKAFGPMLGTLEDGDIPIALIPGKFSGYYYMDPRNGEKVKINKKNESLISSRAYCFYRPLPLKKLGIRDLLSYMFNCLSFFDILRVIIISFICAGIGMLVPSVTKALIGPAVSTGSYNILVTMALTLLLVRLSGELFSTVKDILVERMMLSTSLQVEAAVMTRLLSLNVRFFRGFTSGELAARAVSVREICDIIIEELFGMGLLSLTSLVYVVQIIQYGKGLVVPSLAAIFLTFLIMTVGGIIRTKVNEKHLAHEALENGMKYAMISGVRKIRLTGAENRAFAKWASMYSEGASLVYDPPFFLKIESALFKAVTLIGTLFIYMTAVHEGVGIDDYYAFNAAYAVVMGAFTTLGTSVYQLAMIRPAMKLAEPILAAEPETSKEKKIMRSVRGGIEFSHVYFRYDQEGRFVLRDLSLTINNGEYVAVIGKTGCGKSTLIRLIMGFEKPERGGVYFGKTDIRNIDMKSLRSGMGVVMQNGELIPGSIYDNISLTRPGLSAEEAWKAAEIAGIADDIREMPMGMNTMIAEGQGGVSGGQKQRLLIARAVAGDPKLLIFDEATSALDNRTQKKVTEALDRLNCTRIVIAHRLSTIRSCDRIIVLEDGRIAHEGTYEELEKQGLLC